MFAWRGTLLHVLTRIDDWLLYQRYPDAGKRTRT
jgi:hypothetical protein